MPTHWPLDPWPAPDGGSFLLGSSFYSGKGAGALEVNFGSLLLHSWVSELILSSLMFPNGWFMLHSPSFMLVSSTFCLVAAIQWGREALCSQWRPGTHDALYSVLCYLGSWWEHPANGGSESFEWWKIHPKPVCVLTPDVVRLDRGYTWCIRRDLHIQSVQIVTNCSWYYDNILHKSRQSQMLPRLADWNQTTIVLNGFN